MIRLPPQNHIATKALTGFPLAKLAKKSNTRNLYLHTALEGLDNPVHELKNPTKLTKGIHHEMA